MGGRAPRFGSAPRARLDSRPSMASEVGRRSAPEVPGTPSRGLSGSPRGPPLFGPRAEGPSRGAAWTVPGHVAQRVATQPAPQPPPRETRAPPINAPPGPWSWPQLRGPVASTCPLGRPPSTPPSALPPPPPRTPSSSASVAGPGRPRRGRRVAEVVTSPPRRRRRRKLSNVVRRPLRVGSEGGSGEGAGPALPRVPSTHGSPRS